VLVIQRDGAPASDEAAVLLAEADLLGTMNLCLPRLDAELLSRLPRLRGVVLYATGYDLLDVPLLKQFGVGLSVLPGYATRAVAEHGLALLLGLATRLHLAHDRSRGVAPAGVSLRGVELGGRTLGVLGVGRIGLQTAELARVRDAGRGLRRRRLRALAGVRARHRGRVPRRAVAAIGRGSRVRQRDVRRLLDPAAARDRVAPVPRAAREHARPSLVHASAMTSALRAGRLGGYGVDDSVLNPAVDGDLLEQGRVLQTGHSAWWRDEALARGARMSGERLFAAAVGDPLDAVIWPQRVAAAASA
jgi:lactate dehydrogenase-like 2-hydroxyacid dehydrogenase